MSDIKNIVNDSSLGVPLADAVTLLAPGIGSRINAISERVGGKRKLAELSGMSESQIYRYANESSLPKLEPLIAMARAARVSIDWLATGMTPQAGSDLSATHDGGIQGYPEISAEMTLKVLYAVELFFAKRGPTIRPGNLHKIVLVICKRLVENRRGQGAGRVPDNITDTDEFKETMSLLDSV
ncbi:MAG: helix-turn-helix transcriptional regulator [Magnetococcales bacterium]|nr:helix-turn-helix transcriptional regulator [Magnetococcales bacterium]